MPSIHSASQPSPVTPISGNRGNAAPAQRAASPIMPAPADTERPRLPSMPAAAALTRPSVRSLSVAPPIAEEMYDTSGALNYKKMGAVLAEVKNAARRLDPDGARESQARIDRIIKNLRLHAGSDLYDALKQLAFVIKRESKAEGMQALSAAVFQMARTHHYHVGLSKYDDAARTIARQALASNPNIDTRSQSYISGSAAMEIRASAKLGAQLANAEAGTVSAGIKAGVSRSGMVINDLDTGSLFITLGQANVDLSLNAAIGKIAGNALATVTGTAGVAATRGRMMEGTKAQEVINHRVMHAREGGAFLTPAIAPSREALEARADLATRGVAGRVAAMARAAKARFTDGRFADPDPSLNTHKLVKGAVTEGYLMGEDNLLVKFPACDELRRQLESAYGQCPARPLPSSLKPAVGTGDWIDVSGRASADIGLLKGQVADYFNVTGPGVAAGITYNHRWLPYRAWMAPHAALDALADERAEVKRDLLARVVRVDPSLTAYLDEARSHTLDQLQTHLKIFEDHAMGLLAAQGILRGYARTPPDLSPPQVLLTHASRRFDASLDELKSVFRLSDDECRGVKPHSNKVEGLLARCWNRLSLSLAQASLRADAAADAGRIKELALRIERPNVLMAPEHLYHAATIQMEKTFMRSRVVGNVNLTLPSLEGGSKSNQLALSLGNLAGQVMFDHVTEHPNFVRNGDFLTFDLTARHPLNLDLANVVPRAIATAVAERFQAGGDRRQMHELDQAALLASLSEAYLTLGTNAATAGLNGTKTVQRQFEVCAHRSAKGEPWRLMYIQASNVKNSGIGVSADGAVALGAGGSLGGSATYSRTDNLVMPPILGSAPSVHILQAPRFAGALLEQENGRWRIDPDKLDFDKLRDADLAAMYFSNDSVLDTLDFLHKLKLDTHAEADVFSGLASLGHNAKQFAAFRESGMPAHALRAGIDQARKDTEGLRMAERLKYFTDNPLGRQLLQEYGAGIMQFAAMKSRAFMPYRGTDGRAMKPSIRTASEDKTPLEMPQFSRNAALRKGFRRAKTISTTLSPSAPEGNERAMARPRIASR